MCACACVCVRVSGRLSAYRVIDTVCACVCVRVCCLCHCTISPASLRRTHAASRATRPSCWLCACACVCAARRGGGGGNGLGRATCLRLCVPVTAECLFLPTAVGHRHGEVAPVFVCAGLLAQLYRLPGLRRPLVTYHPLRLRVRSTKHAGHSAGRTASVCVGVWCRCKRMCATLRTYSHKLEDIHAWVGGWGV